MPFCDILGNLEALSFQDSRNTINRVFWLFLLPENCWFQFSEITTKKQKSGNIKKTSFFLDPRASEDYRELQKIRKNKKTLVFLNPRPNEDYRELQKSGKIKNECFF